MIKPQNNMCLIEIVDEYDGIIRDSAEELVQKGVLVDFTLVKDHLTASVGYQIVGLTDYAEALKKNIGSTVYWEQYADTGKSFVIDNKRFTLVPFYRLIGFEEN